MLWSPAAIWRAFIKGRGEKSLYRPELSDAAIRLPLDVLMEQTRIQERRRRLADIAAFAWLLAQSAAVVLTPAALVGAGILA